MRCCITVLALGLALAGCTFDEGGIRDDGVPPLPPAPDTPGQDQTPPDQVTPPGPPNPIAAQLFASNRRELFVIEAAGGTIMRVGEFEVEGEQRRIDELAVDASGDLFGLGGDALFEIDPETAIAERIARLSVSDSFRGLAFVPPGAMGPEETLVAVETFGDIYLIEPDTGEVTALGSNAGGYWLTGDITWVTGVGLVATGRSSSDSDLLLRIDLPQLTIEPIGDIGAADVDGLTSPARELWGFLQSGDVVRIDVTTGAIVDTRPSSQAWRDAAGLREP